MSFLKPKPAKSTSDNQAYGQISSAYMPQVQTGNNATNFLAGLLGVPGGDSSGATAAFGDYKDQAGYAPALRDLQKGVVGGAAARGLLNSGASQKALLKTGAELDQSMFNNFLQQLSGLSGLGLQAGNLVTGAGQRSTATDGSPSTAGVIGGLVGRIGSIFSDRRLKRDINLLSVLPDGLGVYSFRMIDDPEIRLGVMADEVADLRPHALGPVVGGFRTVNYSAL